MTVLDRTRYGEAGKRPIAVITKKMVSEKDLRPKWSYAVAGTDSLAFTPGTLLGNHSLLLVLNKLRFDLLYSFKFLVDPA
jgi:hypothetical protein